MSLQGKGFYIWQISRCENGNANAIGNVAAQAGLSHVLIKIADGTQPYNINSSGQDLVPPVVQALRSWGISVWGWHYIYGYNPEGEANIALQRLQQLNLDGYVIDAEAEFKQPGKEEAARRFMSLMRQALPTFPMALSSYRYPTYHPQFPFEAFLEKCDLNMPQVYWIGAHNPAEQLARCVREFQDIQPVRPIIPTGSAFKEGDWAPTVADINEFLRAAQNLNLSAANFWEWGHTRFYLPEIWEAISEYEWLVGNGTQDIVERYFAALNSHDVEQVLALYNSNAVHVTPYRTVQGIDALRSWYYSLFNQYLPSASFVLDSFSGTTSTRQFSWSAYSSQGTVNDGNDAFGLVNGKVTYHTTFFTIV